MYIFAQQFVCLKGNNNFLVHNKLKKFANDTEGVVDAIFFSEEQSPAFLITGHIADTLHIIGNISPSRSNQLSQVWA